MAAARIAAALLLVVFSAILAAQRPAQVHIKVTVTDTAGGIVQGAQIEIRSESGMVEASAKTGADGSASLDIASGSYILSAAARGFEPQREDVVAEGDSDHVISLFIDERDAICSPCIATMPDIPLASAELEEFIPLLSLRTLYPLPLRRAKKRW
jgi:hypothetical protein